MSTNINNNRNNNANIDDVIDSKIVTINYKNCKDTNPHC